MFRPFGNCRKTFPFYNEFSCFRAGRGRSSAEDAPPVCLPGLGMLPGTSRCGISIAVFFTDGLTFLWKIFIWKKTGHDGRIL
jgi:hypothetical protein